MPWEQPYKKQKDQKKKKKDVELNQLNTDNAGTAHSFCFGKIGF